MGHDTTTLPPVARRGAGVDADAVELGEANDITTVRYDVITRRLIN
jgi:hypothetical protein